MFGFNREIDLDTICNYYHDLLKQKENGKVFSWNDITFEELRFLCWDLSFPDSWIGEIYSVSSNTICSKRGEWNL